MEHIQLIDVLRFMEERDENGKARPFDITFVTANRKKNTGGEIISLENVTKVVGKRKDKIVRGNQLPANMRAQYEDSPKKNPNHFRNGTRNFLLPNGTIRKAHIRLITKFNGKSVMF